MTRKISEFGNFMKAAQTPDDYHHKTDTVNSIKQWKAAALEGNPVAAYRLAKSYPQNSDNFIKWMKTAIDQGLTNAMLDMAKALVEKGSITRLQQAANYLVRVLRSDDSYVKTLANEFISENRVLSAEVSRQMTTQKTAGLSFAGFFARGAMPVETNQILDTVLENSAP